jgi:hypothetical protein
MNILPLGPSAVALLLLLAFSPATVEAADQPCGPATPRHSRSEWLVFPRTDLVTCKQGRTIVEDSAFFGGEFRSDTGHLTTRYQDGGRVSYRVTLDRPGCRASVEGTAVVAGDPLTASDGGTRLTFSDGGVDLKLGKGSCAGVTEEFFFDQDGTRLAEPNDEGSGCDLQVLNGSMDKEKFIRFYYALKRAVASDDRKAVAGMVHYPFVIAKGKKLVRIKRPADFVARFSGVVTPCVRRAILAQRISRLFCRDQGVMFGNGEVWIDDPVFPDGAEDPGPKIITINATACS